jgi:hypothetical protein
MAQSHGGASYTWPHAALINGLTPWLRRLGLGRLPGDFHFRLFGRDWFIPLASTVLLSFLLSLLVKWL